MTPSLKITHACTSCGGHFFFNQVRQIQPAPETPEGEVEILSCPTCNSYDIELLKEVGHE